MYNTILLSYRYVDIDTTLDPIVDIPASILAAAAPILLLLSKRCVVYDENSNTSTAAAAVLQHSIPFWSSPVCYCYHK